jgi:CheY-like chemotaxis protein
MTDPERVFEYFFTTKPVGKGTGLGLALCRAIVERAHGEITAENRPEGGARFVVRLPLATHEPARATPPPGEQSVTCEPLTLGGRSILVVDDEPSISSLQRDVLAAAGASVVVAGSGSEAVGCLAGASFDLVVSDLRMPGELGGRALLEWIERHRPELRERFLFVTGGSVDESDYLDHCGVPHLLKPFTIEEYQHAVRDVLSSRAIVA